MNFSVAFFEFRYLAPEYAETGQITEKADVYAFGVVLLEIITGRKAVDGGILLTDWVMDKLRFVMHVGDQAMS